MYCRIYEIASRLLAADSNPKWDSSNTVQLKRAMARHENCHKGKSIKVGVNSGKA
jgi:hypothetical protein